MHVSLIKSFPCSSLLLSVFTCLQKSESLATAFQTLQSVCRHLFFNAFNTNIKGELANKQTCIVEREFLSFEYSHASMHSSTENTEMVSCKADQFIITVMLPSEVKLLCRELPSSSFYVTLL